MNTYKQLKDKHQAETDAFPIGAAFSDKQFIEMMQKFGLSVDNKDKILSLGCGCFIRKSDETAFDEMIERHRLEMKDAIASDKTGEEFIYDMFTYELANHEYCVTNDLEETLNALELSVDEVNDDERLLHGLNKACKDYSRSAIDY